MTASTVVRSVALFFLTVNAVVMACRAIPTGTHPGATTLSAKAAMIGGGSGDAAADAPSSLVPFAGASDKQVGLNFDVDVNDLIGTIAGAIAGATDRGAFVQSARDKVAYYRDRQGRQIIADWNVLVFNRQQGHTERLRGVQFYNDFNYHGITFGVWVFKDGWFRNDGEGTYANWAFRGSWTRSGPGDKTVTFHARH